MLGPALFPRSLSNQVFSTERCCWCLLGIFTRHERAAFFVADHLHLDNKALRLAVAISASLEIVHDFNGRQHYLPERNRWIERLTARVTGANVNGRWKVIGIDDIADAKCFRIFRNVMLAYYSVNNFRAEVDQAAHEHAIRRSERYALEEREGLSRGYLLEEIALSIRITSWTASTLNIISGSTFRRCSISTAENMTSAHSISPKCPQGTERSGFMSSMAGMAPTTGSSRRRLRAALIQVVELQAQRKASVNHFARRDRRGGKRSHDLRRDRQHHRHCKEDPEYVARTG